MTVQVSIPELAELLAERRERKRIAIQTGAAAGAVLVVLIVTLIVDRSTAWGLAVELGRWWCLFYVFRNMLAWHRIEKAGE
jgi:hypothetical protein